MGTNGEEGPIGKQIPPFFSSSASASSSASSSIEEDEDEEAEEDADKEAVYPLVFNR